jgi:hypothetical protein
VAPLLWDRGHALGGLGILDHEKEKRERENDERVASDGLRSNFAPSFF